MVILVYDLKSVLVLFNAIGTDKYRAAFKKEDAAEALMLIDI